MKRHILLFFLAFGFGSFLLFGAPFFASAALYAPGATLDPSCGPTAPDCGIATTTTMVTSSGGTTTLATTTATSFTVSDKQLFPFLATSAGSFLAVSPNGTLIATTSPTGGGSGSGTVTSIVATVPTGLTVSGSPITTSGTLAFGLATGYTIPLTASTTAWNAKQAALSFIYPLINIANTVSTAFGTTTANSFSKLQQFNGSASASTFSAGKTTLGNTTIIGNNTLTVGTGLTSLGGNATIAGTLNVTGTTILNNLAMNSTRITGLATPIGINDAANKAYVDTFVQGISWQSPVIALATAAAPTTPSTGDRYVLLSGASGFGTCTTNQIAQWSGTAWTCSTPSSGWSVYVNQVATNYNFNGTTWVSLGSTINHNNLFGLQGGQAGQFYHLNLSDYGNIHNAKSQLADLLTTGAPSFAGLAITGSSTRATALSVVGATALTGNVSVSATTTTQGLSAIFANLVSGAITNLTSSIAKLASATITNLTGTNATLYTASVGALTATSTFVATGHTTLANASSTNQSLSGYLNVAGKTTLSTSSTTNFTVSGTQWLTSLGTSAGAFLAVDPSGAVVATTTPGGGGGSGTVGTGTKGQIAYYASNGTTLSTTPSITIANGNVGIGSSPLVNTKLSVNLGTLLVSDLYNNSNRIAVNTNMVVSAGGVTLFLCGTTTVHGAGGLTYGTVLGADGKCWLDRNLGATEVATSLTDAASYGYYYQWGRATDGHQISTSATTTTLSSTDTPGNANFILSPSTPYDWRSPQNNNLWQGVNGINNPCPTGFRIPTQTELAGLITAAGITNSATAYSSSLKLTNAGYRYGSNGAFIDQKYYGDYWSSSVTGTSVYDIYFYTGGLASTDTSNRAIGFSVRCVKN